MPPPAPVIIATFPPRSLMAVAWPSSGARPHRPPRNVRGHIGHRTMVEYCGRVRLETRPRKDRRHHEANRQATTPCPKWAAGTALPGPPGLRGMGRRGVEPADDGGDA